MERLTYRGTPQMTEDGMITPSYSDYPTRRIIERLADYEDAEDQGYLWRLPCKEGDTVYAIEGEELFTLKATKTVYFIEGKLHIECESCRFVGAYCYEDLGTKLFLIKEEAEQELSMQKGDKSR